MAPSPNLQRLHEAGVSIWLDTLSRRLLESGEFAELIGDYSVTGATSKPTIFAKAITDSDGLPAIEELTRRGVNINVTLLFSVERYEQVVEAYLRGLDARVQAGEALDSIALVASFFLSRIDAAVDAQLPEGSPLCGRVALASARVAYQRCLARFAGPQWDRLDMAGVKRQRPLCAGTGTKNPQYPDVHYVSGVIGPDVVNTMPEQTLRAFADHGEVARTLDADAEAARRTLAATRAEGIDLAAVTAQLEREGVLSFCDSYRELKRGIENKVDAATAVTG